MLLGCCFWENDKELLYLLFPCKDIGINLTTCIHLAPLGGAAFHGATTALDDGPQGKDGCCFVPPQKVLHYPCP
jgi:hypothetical protein